MLPLDISACHLGNESTKKQNEEFVLFIRRMGEGTVFSLFVSPHLDEGGTPILPNGVMEGYPRPSQWGELSPSFPTGGRYPILPNWEVPPSKVNMGVPLG